MEFFNKISDNTIYKRIMKTPLSYTTGGVLLGVLAVAHIAVFGKAWGIKGAFTTLGAKVFYAIGIDTTKWAFFRINASMGKSILKPLLSDGGTIRNIGIILGATLATLYASEFKLRKIKGTKQLIGGIVGGVLMGIGATFASGCNIGALFSALIAFSLSGWVFAAALLVGAFIGCKILLKYLI